MNHQSARRRSAPPSFDSRSTSGFARHLFPSANGVASLALGAKERNERVTLEFLVAYYEINRRWARLREVRAKPKARDFARRERAALQAIEKALRDRDKLEDRYAPFGIIAEPLAKDGFTVDVRVSYGNRDAHGRARSDLYTISTFLPLPLPAGTRLEDLPCKIEGPGINND